MVSLKEEQMKKWFLVLLMVLLASVAQAKDDEDIEDCVRRDICWKGQPCICDYPWLLTLGWGIISVDVTCEDGSPASERLVQIRREYLGFEREKITNTNGNVKFLAGIGKYNVMVEGEEKSIIVPGLFLTRKVGFELICYTTTTVLPITTTTSTVLPTTTVITTTSTTTIAGVPHTTTIIYHPGKGSDRPTTTTVKVTTTSMSVDTTTIPIETSTTTEPEPTTSTTIDIITTTTSIKECRTTTTTKKCDEHEG
jgi:hypothetical protein